MAVTARIRDIAALKTREGIPLQGSYDGVNVSFQTPEPFVQTNQMNIRVYRNGQRLRFGSVFDYTVAESGGPGTGYDTVIVAVPPKSADNLIADYRVP
jgi:hypothetical protein